MTISLLAKELGLSVATVSKALRDSHEISTETKLKVAELAKKLNYVPNLYASSLRRKNSKTIAVVLPEVADSFFSLAINGIEEVAQEKGYHVLIYLTHEQFTREEAILNEFKNGRVDGVLLSVSGERPSGNQLQELVEAGIPVVFFDRIFEDIAAARIITDDFESGYMAAKHLLDRGCRQISFLSPAKNLSIISKRQEGYLQALKDAEGPEMTPDIIYCPEDNGQCHNTMNTMLSNAVRPDGVIVSVEKLTAPVYMACKTLKLNIPKDIKIISFTNLQTAPILDPPLTTITQPAFEMGKKAALTLFKGIEKKHYNWASENTVIPSVLVERQSTSVDLEL
jgi:LacI family transcriptional regulator